MTGGVSLIRYWGVSDGFASSPQAFVQVPAAADEPMARERDAQSNQPSRPSVEPAPTSGGLTGRRVDLRRDEIDARLAELVEGPTPAGPSNV
jgi:hypothetical protein